MASRYFVNSYAIESNIQIIQTLQFGFDWKSDTPNSNGQKFGESMWILIFPMEKGHLGLPEVDAINCCSSEVVIACHGPHVKQYRHINLAAWCWTSRSFSMIVHSKPFNTYNCNWFSVCCCKRSIDDRTCRTKHIQKLESRAEFNAVTWAQYIMYL